MGVLCGCQSHYFQFGRCVEKGGKGWSVTRAVISVSAPFSSPRPIPARACASLGNLGGCDEGDCIEMYGGEARRPTTKGGKLNWFVGWGDREVASSRQLPMHALHFTCFAVTCRRSRTRVAWTTDGLTALLLAAAAAWCGVVWGPKRKTQPEPTNNNPTHPNADRFPAVRLLPCLVFDWEERRLVDRRV